MVLKKIILVILFNHIFWKVESVHETRTEKLASFFRGYAKGKLQILTSKRFAETLKNNKNQEKLRFTC